jgi:signal transduction histidine kinase
VTERSQGGSGGGDTAVLGQPERLAAVERARRLLASSGTQLNRLARLAAAGGHAAVGAISLLDADREHFIAAHGSHLDEAPVARSLCEHVISADLPLVIDDTADADASAARAAGIGAYAGFPVHLGDAAVGAVCVTDPNPRHWTAAELTAVSDTAGLVSAMLAEHEIAGPTAGMASPTSDAAMLLALREAAHARAFLDGLLGSLNSAVLACDRDGRLILFEDSTRQISNGADRLPPDRWPGREFVHHPDGRPMRTEELPLMRALRGEHLKGVPMLIRQPGHRDQYCLCNGRQLRSDDEVLGAVVAVYEVTTMVRTSQFKDCEVAVSRVLECDPPLEEAADEVLGLVLSALRWPHAELWLRDGDSPDLRRCATASHAGADGLPPAPGHYLARRACERGRLVWGEDCDTATHPPYVVQSPQPLQASQPARPGPIARPTLAVPIRSAERILGVLTLFATEVDDPADLLEDLLSGIASHIGMFLERRRAASLAQALAASKDEYIGLVGHEMRTPLTSISAYTDLVIEDPALNEDLRSMLAVVQRNSAALRGIIANLLDLAAFDSGHARVQLNPTDFSELVQDVLTTTERPADGGPTVTTDIHPGIRVPADTPRLRQAVENLLSNALRYTPAGGAVVVRLHTVDDPAGDGDTAVLDVADTGIGIPPAERGKLFARFFRGKAAKGMGIPGSGLGLAISRAITEAHNGTLELVDRPGPGSTFRLRLPLS